MSLSDSMAPWLHSACGQLSGLHGLSDQAQFSSYQRIFISYAHILFMPEPKVTGKELQVGLTPGIQKSRTVLEVGSSLPSDLCVALVR